MIQQSLRFFLIVLTLNFILLGTAPSRGLAVNDGLAIQGADASGWPTIKVFYTNNVSEKKTGSSSLSAKMDNSKMSIDQVLGRIEANASVALLVAVDTSGTMRGAPLAAIKKSLNTMLSKKGGNDQLALLSFNDDVVIDVPFTTDSTRFRQGVEGLHTNGSRTVLFKALFKGFELIDNDNLPPCRYILVFSDGKDEGQGYTLNDVIAKANRRKTPVFSLGFASKAGRQYLDNMDRLAQLTGGRYQTVESSDDLAKAWQNMAGLVLDQFVMEMRTDLSADGKEHQLQISYTSANGKTSKDSWTLTAPLVVQPDSEVTQKLVIVPEKTVSSSPLTNLKNKILVQPKLVLYAIGGGILLFLIILFKLLTGGKKQVEVPPSVIDETEKEAIDSTRPIQQPSFSTGWLFKVPSLGLNHELQAGTMSIGAYTDNTIRVDEETVSGYHAEISGNGQQWLVKDLGSTNGTFLNGVRLTELTPLNPGDELRMGCRIIINIHGPGQREK